MNKQKKIIFIFFIFCFCIFKTQFMVAEEVENKEETSKVKNEISDISYLLRAYRKEFSFLENERSALFKRIENLDIDFENKNKNLNQEIIKLEKSVLRLKSSLIQKEKKLSDLENKNDSIENIFEAVNASLEQAGLSLENHKVTVPQMAKNEKEIFNNINSIFDASLALLKKYGSIYTEKGSFFFGNGDETKGEVIHIGQIASLGISEKVSGPLAPAGNYQLKMWDTNYEKEALALAESSQHAKLPIFIYTSLKTEAQVEQKKTLKQLIDSGGLIGWIIVAMGFLGVFLLLIRVCILLLSSSRTEKIIKEISPLVQERDIEGAKNKTKKTFGVAARVMFATLENIDKEAEQLENIIVESILVSSLKLDKFESAIKVFAAIAPLLGLLGTVTGMIATFDVITTYGTGDPKMLSGGISEALVTTQLGLTIAIPLLVFGTFLSAWSEKIKSGMEASALRITNIYKGFKPIEVV